MSVKNVTVTRLPIPVVSLFAIKHVAAAAVKVMSAIPIWPAQLVVSVSVLKVAMMIVLQARNGIANKVLVAPVSVIPLVAVAA